MHNELIKSYLLIRKPFIKLLRFPKPITYVGDGKLEELLKIIKHLNAKRILFIVGGHVLKAKELDVVFKALDDLNITYVVHSGISHDPNFKMVKDATEAMNDVELVVSMGGGSVLDVSKLVKVLVNKKVDAHKLVGTLRCNYKSVPLIAIPTTAGTGSEVTLASVISENDSHLKRQILDPRIIPEYAILDPKLTTSLSKKITSETAFDALTHALEAYVSTYADKQSKKDSIVAIKLIFNNLIKANNTPDDLKAREALLLASYHAGLAFTRVYIGYVHAFAHALGAKCHITHGLATAILLPKVMRYYVDTCQKEFSDLAIMLGHNYHDEKLNANFFLDALDKLYDEANLPKYLEGFKEEMIDEIIQLAFKECHGNYPVPKYYDYTSAYTLLMTIIQTKA